MRFILKQMNLVLNIKRSQVFFFQVTDSCVLTLFVNKAVHNENKREKASNKQEIVKTKVYFKELKDNDDRSRVSRVIFHQEKHLSLQTNEIGTIIFIIYLRMLYGNTFSNF